MAEKSPLSCLYSFLWPFVVRPSSSTTAAESTSNSPSPQTSISNDERQNPALAQAEGKVLVARAAPRLVSSSPFPDEEGELVLEIDPVAFLISKLDEGWFSDNVMRFAWQGIFGFSCPWSGVPPRSKEASNFDDLSESSGILSSDSTADAKSPGPIVRKSIEMVQPLIGAGFVSNAERDRRGFPGARLPRVSTNENRSLSAGEKNSRYSRRAGVDDHQSSEANPKIGEKKSKPASRRRDTHGTSSAESSSRHFSDGDADRQDGVVWPLERVKEEGEFEAADDSRSRTHRSKSSPKGRNLAKPEGRHFGKSVETGALRSSEAGRRKGKAVVEAIQVPVLPLRRRKNEKLKSVKSLSDAEYDELRGSMDLGFNLNRDNLTPRVVSAFPALKFYESEEDLSEILSRPSSISRSRSHSPNVWTTHAESPLLNWEIPALTDSKVDADLKAQLKFWAHSVVHSVSAEC